MADTPPEREPNPAQTGAELDERQRRLALLAMIEDLQASHAQIERARKEWADAFDAVRDPIFLHDREFRVVRANRAYVDAAGMDIKQVIGRPYWEVFPKNNGPLPACSRHMEKAEAEVKLDTGQTYVSRAYAIRDEQGHYLHSIHIFEDVTEKRRAESEKRLLSEALRQSAAAILLVDASLQATYANLAFTRLFGYVPEEMLGKSVTLLAPPPEQDIPPQKEIAELVRRQGFWSGEVLRRGKDGTLIPVLLSTASIFDEQRNVTGFVGSYLDLRERKSMEAAFTALMQGVAGMAGRELLEAIVSNLCGWLGAEVALVGELVDKGRIRSLAMLMDGKFIDPYAYDLEGTPCEDVSKKGYCEYRAGVRQLFPKDRTLQNMGAEGFVGTSLRDKEGRVVGILCAMTRHPMEVLPWLEEAFGIMGAAAAGEIRRMRSDAVLRKVNSTLRALSVCNATVIHAVEERQLLANMCRVLVEAGGFPTAVICYVPEGATLPLQAVAWHGATQDGVEAMLQICNTNPESCPAVRAIRTGEAVIERQLAAGGQERWRAEAVRRGHGSMVALPLHGPERVLGSLNIYATDPDAFGLDEMRLLLEMAEDLSYGISTLRTREKEHRAEAQALEGVRRLRHSLEQTIGAIALALEKRDPYTAGHQSRVAKLSVAMAQELGMPPEQAEGLRFGASIHDIGKIYIPAEILNRPGKLSTAEFEIIKSHSQVGYEIVQGVDFPWPVAQMVLQHHERLDGSGYPKGLTGEAMIPEARILAVADVVEAMASHRPYRPALGLDAALAEIRQHRGRYYDPQAVDACVRLFEEKGFRWDAV